MTRLICRLINEDNNIKLKVNLSVNIHNYISFHFNDEYEIQTLKLYAFVCLQECY